MRQGAAAQFYWREGGIHARWDTRIPLYRRENRTMSKQTAIRLPDETYERLKALSERTGRTSAYYIREAIEKHIEDMEDLYLAEEATRRRLEDNERTYTLEEVKRRLGLDN